MERAVGADAGLQEQREEPAQASQQPGRQGQARERPAVRRHLPDRCADAFVRRDGGAGAERAARWQAGLQQPAGERRAAERPDGDPVRAHVGPGQPGQAEAGRPR